MPFCLSPLDHGGPQCEAVPQAYLVLAGKAEVKAAVGKSLPDIDCASKALSRGAF